MRRLAIFTQQFSIPICAGMCAEGAAMQLLKKEVSIAQIARFPG